MNWQPQGWQPPGWQPPDWQPEGGEGAGITALLSGTATSNLTEEVIRNGGRTIIITLSGDTWVAAGGTFDAVRQAIIDGLTSAQSEATGWNNEVRDKEVVDAVVRTSDTVVTITLTASPLYDIEISETVIATIPASALITSTEDAVSSNTLSALPTQPGMQPVTGRKPTTKKISMRSAVTHVSGQEQAYPVYRFSNRNFVERPKHNPFKDL